MTTCVTFLCYSLFLLLSYRGEDSDNFKKRRFLYQPFLSHLRYSYSRNFVFKHKYKTIRVNSTSTGSSNFIPILTHILHKGRPACDFTLLNNYLNITICHLPSAVFPIHLICRFSSRASRSPLRVPSLHEQRTAPARRSSGAI